MSYEQWLNAEDRQAFLQEQESTMAASIWELYVPGLSATARGYRMKEYPPIAEQLDALWHAINNGGDLKESGWFQSIKAVKDKYPKP